MWLTSWVIFISDLEYKTQKQEKELRKRGFSSHIREISAAPAAFIVAFIINIIIINIIIIIIIIISSLSERMVEKIQKPGAAR